MAPSATPVGVQPLPVLGEALRPLDVQHLCLEATLHLDGQSRRAHPGGPQHAGQLWLLPWPGEPRHHPPSPTPRSTAGLRCESRPALPSGHHPLPVLPAPGRQHDTRQLAPLAPPRGSALQRARPRRGTQATVQSLPQQRLLLLPAGTHQLPGRHPAAPPARTATSAPDTQHAATGHTPVLTTTAR